MHQQYHIAKGWHSVVRMLFAAARLAPRRLRVIATLALALAVGSAGQTPMAQAAPAATEFRFSMQARKLKGNATICVGDDVPIHVRVTRAEFVGDIGHNAQEIPGARVEASMSNGGVGKLNPISIYTGWDSNDPGGANYKFHAEKTGTTIISFKGTINRIWWPAKVLGLPPLVDRRDFVKDQVEITVEDCKYMVTIVIRGVHQDQTMFTSVGMLDKAGMMVDEIGRYQGSASVDWAISLKNTPPCTFTSSGPHRSDVELRGELDGPDLLLDVAIYVLFFQTSVTCPEIGTKLFEYMVAPDPLTIRVPSSGGFSKQPHGFSGGETGSSIIIVERVTGR